MNHEQLVARARSGDRRALAELLGEMKDLVYNLAIRMLGSPADAEDASQEILIRLVTGLDTFRGESSFKTWVYRVASNQLLTTRKRQAEARIDSFEAMATSQDNILASDLPALDDQLLLNEAKLICTSMMLLCLDRDHRLAFILGEILELPSEEAAAVIGIASDAYRKRLSRARSRMTDFMTARCGIVDPENMCSCGKLASNAVGAGYIDPRHLVWATHRVRAAKQAHVDEINTILRAVAVLRGTPTYAGPASLVDGLRALLGEEPDGLLS
jgi:RNA polymerase sigma factor (sigma-70 family)